MVLQQLIPSFNSVTYQRTSFSIDILGRNICNSLEEALFNGGFPFDVIIIGSGMYGAYCASKIFRFSPNKRILVLEAGSFLLPEHLQNLPQIGLNIPSPILPSNDPGIARDLVWGMPWRSNTSFPGLAFCVGGKSIYWGGWCPTLTPSDLQKWPDSTAQYLRDNYEQVEEEIGVKPTTDFINGTLQTALTNRTIIAANGIDGIEQSLGNNGVEEAPLAVQGQSPASGLFSFDKYSSVPLLINAIREDIAQSQGNDANRRLFLVPNTRVIQLIANNGVVESIDVSTNGQRQLINLSSNSSVILATSSIESTRLALLSFPTNLMGRNLMAHVRSDFTVRIRRSAFSSSLPTDLDTAALLVRGVASNESQFHLQITASASVNGSDSLLYQMIPDLDLLEEQLANDDPEWITITLRGVGEMLGDQITAIPNENGNWINLSPFENDEFGVPRAYVQLKLSPNDLQTWEEMDRTTINLAQQIAQNANDIEYFYDGTWQQIPFPLNTPFPSWRRGLGTTYHEAGTLWMGSDPNNSVTNEIGRFHHIENAYVCDQSIFPTVGSVNPVLTGLTLARQLAEQLSV